MVVLQPLLPFAPLCANCPRSSSATGRAGFTRWRRGVGTSDVTAASPVRGHGPEHGRRAKRIPDFDRELRRCPARGVGLDATRDYSRRCTQGPDSAEQTGARARPRSVRLPAMLRVSVARTLVRTTGTLHSHSTFAAACLLPHPSCYATVFNHCRRASQRTLPACTLTCSLRRLIRRFVSAGSTVPAWRAAKGGGLSACLGHALQCHGCCNTGGCQPQVRWLCS